jgi:N-acetyl sugar amidotransferase
MDTSAADITFDEVGVCNYCTEFLHRSSHIIHEASDHKEARLNALVARVKAQGQGKPYDCIVGVSGGVDSSWTLVEVKRLGLRPLAVHMDNGWNSELAQNNISNLVQALDVDLYTHVIDWEEYRGLMQAFFDADVVDLELLYDNAMLAVNYAQANKYKIKYILSGTNEVTEGMKMPPGWNWFKYDKKNIKEIAKINGIKIQSFPSIGTLEYITNKFLKGIKWESFLDYLPFNKVQAIEELEMKYGYKRYPYKHYESIFTRFYQGYILPEKFKIDKRRLHFSSLISSGQLIRDVAIQDLCNIPYPSLSDLESDRKYFLKKMNWSAKDLNSYLKRQNVKHDFYPSEKKLWDILYKIKSKLS